MTSVHSGSSSPKSVPGPGWPGHLGCPRVQEVTSCSISKLLIKRPTVLGWNPGPALPRRGRPFRLLMGTGAPASLGALGHETQVGILGRGSRSVRVGSPTGPVTLRAGLHAAAALVWRVGVVRTKPMLPRTACGAAPGPRSPPEGAGAGAEDAPPCDPRPPPGTPAPAGPGATVPELRGWQLLPGLPAGPQRRAHIWCCVFSQARGSCGRSHQHQA